MRKVHLTYLVLICSAFLYGFLANHYQWFPFYHLGYVRTVILNPMLHPPRTPEAHPPSGVELRETALQRLLIQRVPISRTVDDFMGGGAMGIAGTTIHLVTRDGEVRSYDTREPGELSVRASDLPMHRDALVRSRLRHLIWLPWFRVSGVYAEEETPDLHHLFVSHNAFHAERDCISFNLSRLTLRRSGDGFESVGDWQRIFTAEPCIFPEDIEGPGIHPFSGHISGGRMVPYDDQRLLLTVGDFTYDGNLREPWAMDESKTFGKVLLVDRDSGEFEFYATGVRNNMGIYRDSEGLVWVSESGPQGGDELNLIERGANYGWPVESYGLNYESTPWPLSQHQGRHETYRQPLFAWLPSIAPTAVLRLDSEVKRFELWRGDLLVGSLRGQSLHRLRFGDDGRVVYEERIGLEERIRDLHRLPDGRLVVLTDHTGQLIFLDDGGPVFEPISDEVQRRMIDLSALVALRPEGSTGAGADGGTVFLHRCSSCHGMAPPNRIGPHLGALFTRRVGGLDDFGYSQAMAASDRRWTPELLQGFLARPDSVFPGSTMPAVHLSREEVDSISAYLSRSAASDVGARP